MSETSTVDDEFVVYHGSTSSAELQEAREVAPSATHGNGWTPYKMTARDAEDQAPYFIDNGAYTGSFDADEWIDLLDSVSEKMPFDPDFVVLPDVVDDAEATIEKNREYVDEVRARNLPYYAVAQPGLSVETQVRAAVELDADGLFIGGDNRWKRAYGGRLVMTAHDYGLAAHIGNPGGEDGLEWAFEINAESADTTTVVQNDYWHYLDRLEDAERNAIDPTTEQVMLGNSFQTDSEVAADGGINQEVSR